MGLLLAFAPFIAFLVAERHLGLVPALCAGAAMAVALVVRERLRGSSETRVLEVGTAVLFGVLAACATFLHGPSWSIGLVRLVLDLGLMALVLAGIALDKPFTLAFAREKVTPERAAAPGFLALNKRIAAAWAGAFAVLAVADLVLILQPAWPVAIAIAISMAGVLGALALTRWLPTRATH